MLDGQTPVKGGSGILMGNPQEGPTLIHPAQRLPSNLKAFPSPDLGDMFASPRQSQRTCGAVLAPSTLISQTGKPRLRGARWVSRGHRAFSQLKLRSRCLRPRAHGGPGAGDLADAGSARAWGQGGVTLTLSPPLGFC